MARPREKPVIHKPRGIYIPPNQGNDNSGCVWMLVGIPILYFITRAVAAVQFGTATQLEQIVCWGALAIFLVSLVWSYIADAPKRKAKAAEKEEWIRGCTVAEVKILNRFERGEYDDGYRFHSVPCRLEFEMNADQRAFAPNETTVSAQVLDTVFKNLAKSDTARIYYWRGAPLTFLLEEELSYA